MLLLTTPFCLGVNICTSCFLMSWLSQHCLDSTYVNFSPLSNHGVLIFLPIFFFVIFCTYLNFINVYTLLFKKNTPLFLEWSFVKDVKYFEPYNDGVGNGPSILVSINSNIFNVLYEDALGNLSRWKWSPRQLLHIDLNGSSLDMHLIFFSFNTWFKFL